MPLLHLLCLLLALILLHLYATGKLHLSEFFDSYNSQSLNISSLSKSIQPLDINYINFNLTTKPRVSNSSNPVYNYWKYQQNNIHNQMYKDCDQYRCLSKCNKDVVPQGIIEPKVAVTMTQINNNDTSVKQSQLKHIYENQGAYCLLNPTSKLCPNGDWRHQHI